MKTLIIGNQGQLGHALAQRIDPERSKKRDGARELESERASAVVVVLAVPYVLRSRDLRLDAADRPPWDLPSFVRGFWLSPRRHPDFAWAWLTRFLVNLGNAMGTLLLYFYLDLYTGGAEHAVMHLMYFRFFTKALRDLGLIALDEPTLKLRNQGQILGALYGPIGAGSTPDTLTVEVPGFSLDQGDNDPAEFFRLAGARLGFRPPQRSHSTGGSRRALRPVSARPRPCGWTPRAGGSSTTAGGSSSVS